MTRDGDEECEDCGSTDADVYTIVQTEGKLDIVDQLVLCARCAGKRADWPDVIEVTKSEENRP